MRPYISEFTILSVQGENKDVQSRQIFESMPAGTCGLHAGMDDATGREISSGIPGNQEETHLSGNV